MSKSDNVSQVASKPLRTAFSDLTQARQHKNEWIAEEATHKDTIRSLTDGATGVTYTTSSGVEVGSIDESDPVQHMDWKGFGESDYFQAMMKRSPKLREEVAKHLKPATTTVTIRSKYHEDSPQTRSAVRKTSSPSSST